MNDVLDYLPFDHWVGKSWDLTFIVLRGYRAPVTNHERRAVVSLSPWVVKYNEVRYGILKPSLKTNPLYKLAREVDANTSLNPKF